MNYQKKGSRVLIGDTTIPSNLVKYYLGALCFSTQTEAGTNEFVVIACSHQQLEELVVAVNQYLAEHPLHTEQEA